MMPLTILLVDDDEVQAATRRAILSYAGHKVLVAKNAKLALHLLTNLDLAQQVGLVITDHLMPGMNGPEFVAELRSRFPALPVFVLSGYPDAEPEYQGTNVLYRLKPIAPQELIRLVDSIAGDQLTRIA